VNREPGSEVEIFLFFCKYIAIIWCRSWLTWLPTSFSNNSPNIDCQSANVLLYLNNTANGTESNLCTSWQRYSSTVHSKVRLIWYKRIYTEVDHNHPRTVLSYSSHCKKKKKNKRKNLVQASENVSLRKSNETQEFISSHPPCNNRRDPRRAAIPGNDNVQL